MIIACPACSTRYVVPDSAIGVEGRTVRCAKCRHSWFQQGAELPAQPESTVGASAASRPSPERPISAAAVPQADPPPQSEPDDQEAVQQVPEPPAVLRPAPRDDDDAFAQAGSRFEHEPPFRPRRNTAKLWTMAAAGFALFVAGLIGLAAVFGLPNWLPLAKATFGAGQPDLVLSFPAGRQDRRTLPNGTAYFGASGTVTNVGKDPHEVPPILIVLRDSNDKVVYIWNVTPPRDSLTPGESVTINVAVTDGRKSAKVAEIGWKHD